MLEGQRQRAPVVACGVDLAAEPAVVHHAQEVPGDVLRLGVLPLPGAAHDLLALHQPDLLM